MNGELQVLAAEAVIFPVQQKDAAENTNLKEKEVKSAEANRSIHLDETRFARLKKSLRKRSASIL